MHSLTIMDCKFVAFSVFAIAVGVTLPVFGRPDSTEDRSCPTEFLVNPIFIPFKDLVDGIYELFATTQPNDYSELENDKCRSYSIAQKLFDVISVGMEITDGKDCPSVPEINGIEKSLIPDADNLLTIFYSAVRMIIGNNTDFATELDYFQKKSFSKTTGAFHVILNGIKIVFADICPGNELVQVEDSLGSLKAMEEKVVTKTDYTMKAITRGIEKTCDDLPEYNMDGKVDCTLQKSEIGKVHNGMIEFFHNIFGALKNLLPKKPE